MLTLRFPSGLGGQHTSRVYSSTISSRRPHSGGRHQRLDCPNLGSQRAKGEIYILQKGQPEEVTPLRTKALNSNGKDMLLLERSLKAITL